MLETLAEHVPGDLDLLAGDERARVYRMLRLEVSLTSQGGLPGKRRVLFRRTSSVGAYT